jgi:L,D-peptidoglycan transpeptidase YkuD (ErfK/YbiS/YcfS/YnhG family)
MSRPRPKPQALSGPTLRVRRRAGEKTRGWLTFRGRTMPVSLGRAGILANKREGDGATPRGTFRLLRLWYRRDRGSRPRTRLPIRPIGPADAWCEDPTDRRYNRPICLIEGQPGDRLKRIDHLYDLIIEVDHNTRPRIAGRGSAVFIHLARQHFLPTAGCVGLTRNALFRLLEGLSRNSRIEIR